MIASARASALQRGERERKGKEKEKGRSHLRKSNSDTLAERKL